MANFVSRWQFTIEWGHCDPAGIVFNSRFFEFFDWGTWTLFEAALGIKPPDLAAAFGILGIPLVDTGARFLAPARFGDVVELSSEVSEFRRSSFDVAHRLFVRGELAVEGRETRVWAVRDATDPPRSGLVPFPLKSSRGCASRSGVTAAQGWRPGRLNGAADAGMKAAINRKAVEAFAWRAFFSSRSMAAHAAMQFMTMCCCWIICGKSSG